MHKIHKSLSEELSNFVWSAKNLSESHNVTLESLVKILEVNLEKGRS